MILEILFFSLSNTDFQFDIGELIQSFYIAIEALPTISQVKLIDKQKFAKATLDKNSENFIMNITAVESIEIANMIIYYL